jgi:hypothetical protein
MALRNAFEDLALESTLQALRLAVAALTRTIGLMTPDAAGRMRVTLESAPAVVPASQSELVGCGAVRIVKGDAGHEQSSGKWTR